MSMFTIQIPKVSISDPVKDILIKEIQKEFFNVFKQDKELQNLEDKIIFKFSEIASKIMYFNIEEDRGEIKIMSRSNKRTL